MKQILTKSEGETMTKTSKIVHLITVQSAFFLILCAWIGFLSGCSAEGSINGPTIHATGFDIPEDHGLEWTTPEEVGWSSAELQLAHLFAIESGCNAVMALYDGKVFFSRGNVHQNYPVDSIRMPFLNALYGIHRDRGNLHLNTSLADLHLDDIDPGLTPEEKQAEVAHLLMSRSGVYHEAADESPTMIEARPARASRAPDEFFYYNNWDFNALGTIFEQETGEGIFNAFKREIADVLEMVDFSIDNCVYQYQWNKSLHPAYHFKMSVRDMAKFGALYQNNGLWKGQQIIASSWIDESTMAYSTMDETTGAGHGYLWKVIPQDSELGQTIGYPGFYHTGQGGLALVVLPDIKLVIVEHYDTEQGWDDPGSDAFELAMLILDARLDD
jgi:hypothetical protein